MWEKTNAFRVFVGRPEGKRPLRRGVDWRIILKLNSSRMRRTGLIRRRLGTHGGLL